MALKGQLTKASFLEWDSMLSLLAKLERDQEYKFELLISIGSYTALRIGDLLKLRWKDLYQQRELVLVEGKTKKTRRIPIHPNLLATITRLHDQLNITDVNELIFLNKFKTKAFNIQYVNRRLKEIAIKYKLSIPMNSISSHFLRKTMARHVWEINNHSEKALLLLGDALNHSSIAITKRYLGIKDEEVHDIYINL